MDPKQIAENLKKELGLTLFEAYIMNLQDRHSKNMTDPVEWAKDQLKWDARWYQAQFLRDTSSKVALRWGRRAGKTTALAVKALLVALQQVEARQRKPGTVCVITPYENQLSNFFETLRGLAANIKDLGLTRDIRDPQGLSFSNGSRIIGFAANIKTGARSEMIRGQDINYIIIDEASGVEEVDMHAVLAVFVSSEDSGLVMSGTPCGEETMFQQACEDKTYGFKEYWIASHESPAYSKDADTFFRRMFSKEQFRHEILACF